MTASTLLAELRARDIHVWAEGDQLQVNAVAGVLTAELREQLRQRKGEILEHLRGPAELSFSQQRFWFLDQVEPGGAAYVIPEALEICGTLDVPVLERALGVLVSRHDSLRTVFMNVEGRPLQVVSEPGAWTLPVLDLSGEADARQWLTQRLREEAARGFDLARGPLFRARLYRLAADTHVLLLTMHHIISDGWSMGVLKQELGELYGRLSRGEAATLPALRLQYRDFARWQHGWLQGEALDVLLSHWRARLAGAPHALELPTDRPRPSMESYRGAIYSFTLPLELVDALRGLARREGATLYMTLLSSFALLLSRYSGQQDLLIGTPVANRNRAEMEDMVGCFVNTLVLRADLSGDPSASQFLGRMREVCLDAFAHQDLPFDRLVEEMRPQRDLTRNPLFQVMFAMENAPLQPLGLPGLTLRPIDVDRGATQVDLTLKLEETAGGLGGAFEYATDLFDEAAIARMAAHYRTLLEGMVASPRSRVSDLALLPASERQQLLVEWNRTGVVFDGDMRLHRLFEEQVARTPLAEALVSVDERLSYEELNRRANRLAHQLRALGAKPETLVAVCLQRSSELVVALLAVLKSGAAYVPLDPEYPAERIAFMLKDSQAAVLVTNSDIAGALPQSQAQRLYLDQNGSGATYPDTNPPDGAAPEHLAYVIYTSGSTGVPKGVAIEQRNAATLVHWARTVFTDDELRGVLASTSVCFDLSIFELFLPLAFGGRVILAENALHLPELPAREEVTLVNTVPSAAAELVRMKGLPGSVTTVCLAGEPLPTRLVDQLYDTGTVQRVYDLYGPSEDTTYSTYTLRKRGVPPTIGRPIANTRAYVLDARMNPVPVGMPGELYLGGAGLARGYLGRPELTRERFLRDPFLGGAHRVYRTGDLVRYRPDAQLEYLGRLDHQVKLRGFRIELGEIETGIARHPAIREVVVIVREDTPGDKRLVAYLVADDAPEDLVEQLRAQLRARLPAYMVPAAFVTLETLPQTPNGKVDRKALPAPDATAYAARSYEAPASETEATLAQIWAEVLKLDRVGRHDHFFELGGHSLLAMSVIERMRRAGLHAEVRALFVTPTLAALAAAVGGESRVVEVPPNRIPPVCEVISSEMLPLVQLRPEEIERIVAAVPGGAANVQDIYPLAPLQEGMLFHHLMAREGDPYLLDELLGFDSRARLDGYVHALQAVIERHDILRTAVLWEGLPEPVQVVWRRAPLIVEEVSLDAAAGDVVQQLRARFDPRHYRLDVREAPLLRAFIAHDAANARWVMLQLFHHLSGDHTTLEVLQQEIQTYLLGQPGRLPAPLPFRNFVAQARLGVSRDEHETFFRKMLGDVDEPTAPFGLTDVQGDGSGIAEAYCPVDAHLARRLRERARALGVSAASVCHLAWAQVLARVSGREDVVFGTVLFGRMQGGEGADRALGLFINTLPVRIRVGSQSVQDSVRHTHTQLAQLLRHEHAPLSLAQRCSMVAAPAPLFSALLNYRHSSAAGQLPMEASAGMEYLGAEERTNYPFVLSVDDLGEGFALTAQVQSPVDPQRICAYMHTALEQLLGALESAPATSMRSLDVLPASERQQLLVEWNRTGVVFDGDMRLHRLFEEQVARTPLAEALVSVDERLSYEELNRRANRLAHQLRALGAKPETLVAVCLQRSSELVVALLAVLKSGAAYVPLDPEYPAERIAFMLKDSQAAVLVTNSDIAGALPQSQAQRLYLDQNGSGATYPDTNPPDGAAPEHLAYVIYTSGSTGVPKGVAIEQRNAATLVHWARTVFTDDELRGVLASTSVCFDLSIFELFLPLAFGGRVILAENALHLPELPAREEVTLVNTVPSAAAELVRMKGLPGSVTTVCLAGEPLPTRLVDQLYDTGTVQRVYDLYGPSEDTTYSTYTLRKRGVPPTIGRPIANTRAYVLDARMNPVPVGMPGELYLGGAGLARGYLGRPELTRERFLRDPFLGGAHRVYRTGDLVRYRPDAQLEYLGRLDHQVKLRGFRIELGEIETGIARHPAIREVVVIVREDTPGDKRLVAYLVADDAPEDLVEQLRAQLRARLPAYMVPAAFVTLETLPQTPNGKVDRKALPAPDLSRSSAGPSYAAPRTPTESAIAQIWSAVLGIDRVGIHDHFFELGGDSILSIQVIARCRQAGLQLTPRDLFKRPTIALLAQACAQPTAEITGSQEPLTGAVEFTPIQRWFLEQDFTDPHHWNQAFMFELPADVDLSALEQALHCVLRHHDALRLRLRPAGKGWVQEYAPDSALPALSRIDLAGIAAEKRAAAVEEQATRVQSTLHLEEGCLLRAVYFAFGAGERGRLLLVIHHLAVDGVSWRLISEDLESAYSSLKASKRPVLAPKTTSYQAWAARLADFARSSTPRRSLPFWIAEASKPVSALPAQRNDCENLEGDARSVKTRLTAEDTRALLQRVPTAYRTQVNDVLLSALARALQRWTDGEAFRIDLEGHGREDLFADLDVSRTVGWFTTMFPVRLELQAGLDEGQALKSVKEQLRRLPDRGLSYGLLRYACDDAQTRAALSQSPRSELLFNYLGQFDQVVAGSNLLSFAPESIGPYHSPAARRTHALEVLCLVRAGELEIEWTYHPGIHRRETIERVAQDFVTALRAIIAHCLAAHAGGRTPSDFPLAALGQEALDKLWARYPGFEDVYPLSPMQRLFYVAESAHTDLEYEPWHFRLDGAIDGGLLRRAIERVVERHSILRTAFAAEISAEPLQVVLQEVAVPWSEEDWRGLPAAEQEARRAALLQSQRRTRFDLAQPPLMRMALRRTGDETYHLVWSTHHLHIDGWSWPLIFGEVSKVYEALRQGSEPQLERPYAYRSYVAWLHDEAPDSEVFWKETLAGFEAPTPLNLAARPSGPQPRAGLAGEFACLDRDTTAALQSLARSQRVTLSTVVQAAWALLLSHYSGSRDVLFGAAFSGRPVEVPGIESLVGPCVTNLPVRVTVAPQESLLPWLLSLQQRQFELAHHQHAALEQIQTWANLPWQYRLFDSLIVFQNYQVDEAARRIGDDARVVPISGPGSTSYPLTIMVVPEGELQLQFICHPGEFAPDVVRTYATDLTAILHAMAQRPDQALGQLLAGLPASSRGRAAATAATKATGATPIGTAVAPRTPSEELVIGVFRDLLDRADLGVFDDFFDLGGNSVAAAQLMSRLRAASGFDLPLRNLFERPTVAGLAEVIDGLAWVAKSKALTSGAARREEIEL